MLMNLTQIIYGENDLFKKVILGVPPLTPMAPGFKDFFGGPINVYFFILLLDPPL